MSALLPGGVVQSVRFDRDRWSERDARRYLESRGVVPVRVAASMTNIIMVIRDQPYSSYATHPASSRGVLVLVGR